MNRFSSIASLSLAAVLLTSCGGGGSSSPSPASFPSAPPPAVVALTGGVQELSCAAFAHVDAPGVGRLINNTWNAGAAGTFAARQCLVARPAGDATQYGWAWSWPENGHTVYAYPEVIMGWKPWDGGSSNTPALPARIGVLEEFSWQYSLDVVTTGKHNLATSLWITRSGATPTLPNPSDIAAEVMIWSSGEGFWPGGSYITTLTVDNIEYEVWYERNWGDVSGSSGERWSYIAFRSRERHTEANLNVKAFLDFAVSHGWLNPQHYVANIELGNEVMSGSGYTWINSVAMILR